MTKVRIGFLKEWKQDINISNVFLKKKKILGNRTGFIQSKIIPDQLDKMKWFVII